MGNTYRKIVIVAGTRPEAIKLAPIIWSLKDLGLDFIFVWTGQHYGYEMSKIFFDELGLPKPDIDLDVRSGSHAEQVAKIIIGVENIVRGFDNSGIVIAEGDTNTVLGAGLAAVKSGWLLGHVEAGLRSFSRIMPEEINRVVVDTIANIHFAPSINAVLNLLYEGITPWRIHLVGNTIVDVVYNIMHKIRDSEEKILEELNINEKFGLVTLHRAENVDNPSRLKRILSALKEVSKDIELVFPIHPRTRRKLSEFNLRNLVNDSRIKIIKPLGYIAFLGLMSKAQLVLTDSGGVQEEALTLAIPCITLRNNTERPETVHVGGNFLVGDDPRRIIEMSKYVLEHREEIVRRIKSFENPYGDGRAGERIARILKEIVEDEETYDRYAFKEPDYRDVGDPIYILVEGDKFAGLKVEDFQKEYPNFIITLIYDENGKPIIPFPDRTIKNTWKLRIWGPRKHIEKLLR